MTDEESKVLVDSLERGTCWANLMCKEAANRIAQLEARVATADKLAEAFCKWNESPSVIARVSLMKDTENALAAYQATKEHRE